MKNIFAYTANTQDSYPEYISFNVDEDKKITMTVRSAKEVGSQTVEVRIPYAQLVNLEAAINNYINKLHNPHLNP